MKKTYQPPCSDWIRTEDLDLLTTSDPSDPYGSDIW